MVELVDTRDLKSLDSNIVPVQVRPRVPFEYKTMEQWLVATYKINEVKRTTNNLSNQGLNYYLPKITTKNANSIQKENILFPGYIFIKTDFDKFALIKYTKGINSIIKFGKNIPYITDDEIKSIREVEESSKSKPLISKIKIGQEVVIKDGTLKGNIAKICSLPSKKGLMFSFIFLVLLERLMFLKKLNNLASLHKKNT